MSVPKHDWQAIYKNAQNKGEAFRDISEADYKWIEEETSKYKFDENDNLKMTYLKLKNQASDTNIEEQFEELQDLLETAQQNNLNLCRMGGMGLLLDYIVTGKDNSIRTAACKAFTTISANNDKVQVYGCKYRANNLVIQMEAETNAAMREQVFGALLAFLKAGNFDGKRDYVTEM